MSSRGAKCQPADLALKLAWVTPGRFCTSWVLALRIFRPKSCAGLSVRQFGFEFRVWGSELGVRVWAGLDQIEVVLAEIFRGARVSQSDSSINCFKRRRCDVNASTSDMGCSFFFGLKSVPQP